MAKKKGQNEGCKAFPHLKWPKFLNVHALIANSKISPEDDVIVLEKLDGSNLGLEISPDKGLVAVHGRKDVLWHSGLEPEKPLERTYGPIPDTLESLADEIIPKLTNLSSVLLCLAKSRGAETVIFYGEWYKETRNEPAAWYPFGFAIRDNRAKDEKEIVRTMTTKSHQLFVDHGLLPPKILFSGGTLSEAVDSLYEAMLNPRDDFEGVFITRDGPGGGGYSGGCKWKTGDFEEQSKFVIKDKHVTTPEMQEIVSKLKNVYDTKTKKLTPYKPKWRKDDGEAAKGEQCQDHGKDGLDLDRQVVLALHSVLSKCPSPLEKMDEMELQKLKEDTVRDVIETLETCNTQAPANLEEHVDQTIQDRIDQKPPGNSDSKIQTAKQLNKRTKTARPALNQQ